MINVVESVIRTEWKFDSVAEDVVRMLQLEMPAVTESAREHSRRRLAAERAGLHDPMLGFKSLETTSPNQPVGFFSETTQVPFCRSVSEADFLGF